MEISEDKMEVFNKAINRILLPDIKDDTLLYHYTSVDNLGYIIKDDGIHFRTTHYASLNDYTELYWGRIIQSDVLESFNNIDYEKIANYYEDAQIVSLSMYGNSLPMWKMYGGNKGISIGIKGLCNKADDYYALKVVYGRGKWNKMLDRLKLSNFSMIINLMFAPLVIKHPAFEYEQEVRLVILKPKETLMQHNALRSFIHLAPEHLGCVYVGPTQDKDIVIKIKKKLSDLGYKGVPVYHSNIPYVER